MLLHTMTAHFCSLRADGLTRFSQPVARPGKLEPQYRQTRRDEHECRARRDDHDHTKQQHGRAHDGHYDPPDHFVGQVHDTIHLKGSEFRNSHKFRASVA